MLDEMGPVEYGPGEAKGEHSRMSCNEEAFKNVLQIPALGLCESLRQMLLVRPTRCFSSHG